MQLEPRNLSFFHFIVLANIVHNHEPLYSLLKRRCYSFANTIYLVIENSYKCKIANDFHRPKKLFVDNCQYFRSYFSSDLDQQLEGLDKSAKKFPFLFFLFWLL